MIRAERVASAAQLSERISASGVVRRAVAPKGNALEDLKITGTIASKHLLPEGKALSVAVEH